MIDLKSYLECDPRTEMMEQECRERAAEEGDGKGYWLWDDEEATLFIMDELARDGKELCLKDYAYWIQLRYKLMKGKIRDIAYQYVMSQARDYGQKIGEQTIFEWLKSCGTSYPEALLTAYYTISVDRPQNYSPVWDYVGADGNLRHLNNDPRLLDGIVMLPDGNSYRFKTEEERKGSQ